MALTPKPPSGITSGAAIDPELSGGLSAGADLPSESQAAIDSGSEISPASSAGITSGSELASESPSSIDAGAAVTPVAPDAIDSGSQISSVPADAISTGSQISSESAAGITTGAAKSTVAHAAIGAGSQIAAEPSSGVSTGSEIEPVDPDNIPQSAGGIGFDFGIGIGIGTFTPGSNIPSEQPEGIDSGSSIATKPAEAIDTGSALQAKAADGIDAGSSLSAKASAGISVGAVLSSKTLPTAGPNYPVIGWQNELPGNSTATSDDAAALLAPNVLTLSTWDRFASTGASSTLTISLITPKTCDYIAIAGLNLHTAGGTLTIQTATTSGGAYSTVATITSSTRSTAALSSFSSRTVGGIKLIWSGGTGQKTAAVVFAGLKLAMQRPQYAGVKPLSLISNTGYTPQTSDSGQFLGRQIVRQGVKASASFRHLDDDWYRTNFDPFARHAIKNPFFFAWNPDEDPAGVIYAWAESDIQPEKMGIRDMLSVSIEMMGHR